MSLSLGQISKSLQLICPRLRGYLIPNLPQSHAITYNNLIGSCACYILGTTDRWGYLFIGNSVPDDESLAFLARLCPDHPYSLFNFLDCFVVVVVVVVVAVVVLMFLS